MHNETEEGSIIAPAETERLAGELGIDYQRNRVLFHPNARRELTLAYRSRRRMWISSGVWRGLLKNYKRTVCRTRATDIKPLLERLTLPLSADV